MQLSYRFSEAKNPEEYSKGGEDGLEETPIIGYQNKAPIYNGMPSWGVLKFSSKFKLTKNLKTILILDNLLDIHYREFASGISSPGRNLNIVFEYDF
jgi:hemoglobin/transferrin/lactoferrin receptor protein